MKTKCALLTRNFSEKILTITANKKTKRLPVILMPIKTKKEGKLNV